MNIAQLKQVIIEKDRELRNTQKELDKVVKMREECDSNLKECQREVRTGKQVAERKRI